MDDSEHVCPLCCEELDISDRQFFPCKCGYQVCMWCWHRIRESESGLCPACRTPYGDDPHEFSAVDVEEVLRANKEKEAAAKRERDRQRQQQNDGNLSDGEGVAALLSTGARGQMEIPKDRSQLANMRVIRRNLVYCVGLPPTIASEDTLRKPEYFGQYGKISKIVLNRSQTTAGTETRRASASAYVTFVHKEDTLSCILAMDGCYLDGRNVRASYGTSKYCSAFIKNVRCNNPECTYLHIMGDIEDTFTKQEIQAGYVTSGRDVLARQQQIVREQQALSAASGAPRRKVGGGGPSGSGKASSSPVFPPPAFDEPAKQSTSLVPPPPPPAAAAAATPSARAATTGTGFPTIAAANANSGSMSRSSSSGAISTGSAGSYGATAAKGTIGSAAQVARKGLIGAPTSISSNGAGAVGATAASVVAGVHSISGSNEPPAPHTTLTPLTPLKRGSVSKGTKTSVSEEPKGSRQNVDTAPKLTSLRPSNGKKANGLKPNAPGPTTTNESIIGVGNPAPGGSDGIGGAVIAAPVAVAPPVIGGTVGSINPIQSGPSPLSELGGQALGGLGGEVFDGPLQSSGMKSAIGTGAPIGSGLRNQTSIGGDHVLPSNAGGGLWASNGVNVGSGGAGFGSSSEVGPGGNTIMGGTIGTIGGGGTGSSALASMLGINLPTGSGSLRESPSLWGTSAEQAPISSLNQNSFPVQGVIGSGASNPNNGLIGGVTIGGGGGQGQGPMGSGTNKSDIALLQSLLPGVHITSGGSGFGAIGGGGGGSSQPLQTAPVGSNNLGYIGSQQQQQWTGGLQSSLGGAPAAVGAIGQGSGKQNQRQSPGNIW